jgi:hypothetical protein
MNVWKGNEFCKWMKINIEFIFPKKINFHFFRKKKNFETFVTRIESIIWSLLKVKLIDYRFHLLL